MIRNQITTVSELKPGDRFYKHPAKNKKVLQFLGEGSKLNSYEICEASVLTKNGFPKPAQVKEMAGKTVAVYLWNISDRKA